MSSRIRYTNADEIIARADAEEREVLDPSGNSDFVQRVSGAPGSIDAGMAAFGAVDDQVTTKTVSHGLGVTPVIVVATPKDPRFGVSVDNTDSTSFRLRCVNNQGSATNSVDVWWLAVG